MSALIFQVDAFTSRRFAGNPAAVVSLESFPADSVMQAIAAENNLAETAFIVADGVDYHIRWFTPTVEVPLCGHATLASAAVVMERLMPTTRRVVFHSKSGPLAVHRTEASYIMNFPARPISPAEDTAELRAALRTTPVEVVTDSVNIMALLADAQTVRTLSPNFAAVSELGHAGVIVTAVGDDGYDFISRYFAPAKGIPEDPVTGGAHCSLAPYWAKRLGRTSFRAFQASQRGGEIRCRIAGDRVELEGECVFYLEGRITF